MEEISDKIEKALKVWKAGDPDQALLLLDSLSLEDNCEAIFLSGEIHYNCQNWGSALNCFRLCLQINPEMRSAQTYVDLILNILGFFHTDQFNP